MAPNPLIRRKEKSYTTPMKNQSMGILDDFAVRKVINTQEGTIEKVPVDNSDIANKSYVDSVGGGAPEGTAVKSTGEVGATKFLREDGDGTCSWQSPAGGGDVTAAANLTDVTIVQGDGGAKGVKTSTATVGQIATNVSHTAGDGSDHADVASNTTHRGVTTGNPHVVLLDEVGNPSANQTFSMANKGIAFDFTNPTGAGEGFDGAFNIEANGAFTGDLLHLHQHTGNPGAGTHMIHLESTGSNVIPIGITSVHATGIDMGTSKIVALVDPTSDQEAATKKYVDDNDADTTDHTALSNIGTNTHAQIDTSITATGVNSSHVAGDGSDHADVATNTSASHTQGTDTTLGSGAVAADHGTAATDQIVNISYGTGAPPTANTTTIGSLFIQHEA